MATVRRAPTLRIKDTARAMPGPGAGYGPDGPACRTDTQQGCRRESHTGYLVADGARSRRPGPRMLGAEFRAQEIHAGPVATGAHGKISAERRIGVGAIQRSEEHTSELQSPCNLVC